MMTLTWNDLVSGPTRNIDDKQYPIVHLSFLRLDKVKATVLLTLLSVRVFSNHLSHIVLHVI